MLKAQALAESINHERRLGHVLTYVAAELWIRTDYRAALEAGRRAAAIAKMYGKGRWRKLKGVASVRLQSGAMRKAGLHCYEG
jgi:hypothetical protein